MLNESVTGFFLIGNIFAVPLISSVAANYLLVLFSYQVQAAQKQNPSKRLTPISSQRKANQSKQTCKMDINTCKMYIMRLPLVFSGFFLQTTSSFINFLKLTSLAPQRKSYVEIRKNVLYFTPKSLFVLEIFKF